MSKPDGECATPVESGESVTVPLGVLEALQRQAMVGSVATMVLHEFNNLMTPVLARAEYAMTNPDPQLMLRSAEITTRNTEHALTVARRLLTLTCGKPENTEDVCVAEAIESAILMMARPFAKDGIEFSLDVNPGCAVRAERVLFESILLNLSLIVRADVSLDHPRIDLLASVDEADVVLKLRFRASTDAPDPDVFRPFFQREVSTDPTDWRMLGPTWNICRHIAIHHGARLGVDDVDEVRTILMRWPRATGS